MEIRADGISKKFFRKGRGTNYFTAVEPTDFTLYSNKLTSIMGRSGSGKTTLINMLSGLLVPSEGKVYLGNCDIYEVSDIERSQLRCSHIGVIPQGYTGLQSLTVLENILAPSRICGGEDRTEKAMELMDKMGITHLAQVYSNELSGGEQRRMSIARALINSPHIIIADEPTSDLDEENTVLIMGVLREMADTGAAVLMVTHDKQAAGYADAILTMDNGRLIT